MHPIRKYPRTPHLQGSKLQPGDEDLEQVPLRHLVGRSVVVEEKVDGANCAVSFTSDRELLLQSRGHYLEGGPREEQFGLLKTWASCFATQFWELLTDRYIMYGEWLYAKHTVYYDHLPHYFMEFDIYDRVEDVFLSTPRRHEMLAGTPVVSVPVLLSGDGKELKKPEALLKPSLYKSSSWKDSLKDQAASLGQDAERVFKETDLHDTAEGLYVKVEESGVVSERYKWVRHNFLQAIADSGSHWRDRPTLPNRLAPGVDLFGGGS